MLTVSANAIEPPGEAGRAIVFAATFGSFLISLEEAMGRSNDTEELRLMIEQRAPGAARPR